MPELASKPGDPPPVRLGRLKTPSAIRCACTRIGNAVLAGKLDPKKANSALYAVAGAKSAMDLEQQAKALELEQQRVNIEAARARPPDTKPPTTEELLALHAATRPRPTPPAVASLPAPAAAPAAIQPPLVSAPAAAAISPSNEPREAQGDLPSVPPRAAHELDVIDAQPQPDGSWTVPQPPPPDYLLLGTEGWRAPAAGVKEISPGELEGFRERMRSVR